MEDADGEVDGLPMIRAALKGQLDEVRRLVQQDRRLLEVIFINFTPLACAAYNGRVEVVRYLLDEGAQVNLKAEGGSTALECACMTGQSEVVKLLVARGAGTGKDGLTALTRAVHHGHTDVVEALLACGDQMLVDYAMSKDGGTILHYACFGGCSGVVRVLLRAGADPHLGTVTGGSPRSFAEVGHLLASSRHLVEPRQHAGCLDLLYVSFPRECALTQSSRRKSQSPVPYLLPSRTGVGLLL
jgi:hypothetical protein